MASEQSPSSPRLCISCYVFYGSGATGGMCSACYRELLKQEASNRPDFTDHPATFSNSTVVWDFSLESNAPASAGTRDSVLSSATASTLPGSSCGGVSLASRPLRCASCNKKLGVLRGFKCKCGNSYCVDHRYAEKHQCGYDYKAAGRELLEKKNPVIKSEKLQRI